jgi:translation initiation factor 1 (eIF-1/SUI1)
MGKKQPPSSTAVPVGESGKLTHNPFAGIAPAPSAPAAVEKRDTSSPPPTTSAARRGRLVLARETKHRGGKAVVIVRGFRQLAGWDDAAIEGVAKELKRALGCGGTAVEGEIVVQGDRPAQVAEWLRAQGFRVDGVTS